MLSAVLAIPLGLADATLYFKAYENADKFFHSWALDGIWRQRRWRPSSRPLLFLYIGVALGGLVALPVASVASPFIAPPRLSWAVWWVSSAVRSIPAVLWAVFYVILVGPGPVAGAFALALYTSTYLVKLFYEALEAVERELYDSLRAIGLRGPPRRRIVYTRQEASG